MRLIARVARVTPFSTFRTAHRPCSIYPGHGSRFVSRTGLLVILSCSKASALFHARKKPGAYDIVSVQR